MDSILIIDKTPSLYRLREISESLGHKVIEASNSMQSINKINSDDSIRLVIIDVLLDKEDGFQLIKDIKHINPRLPVMIITSLNGRMDFVRGIKVGATDYILKPFNDNMLIDRINSLIEKSSNHDMKEENIGIDFNSYLDSEINKSIKGKYPISIGMIVLYKNHYDPEHSDLEYMKYQSRLYKKFKKIFFETDFFIPYGSQSFLVVMPFCKFDNIHIVRSKIITRANEFIYDLAMDDFHIATSFVNLPIDGKTRDMLLDKLINQMNDNINSQMKISK